MIWLLRRFGAFRALQGTLRELQDSLQREVLRSAEIERRREEAEWSLEVEKSKRISAEALAFERNQEIQRLLDDLRESRAAEREKMKSLDALNVKLMQSHVEQPAPDMSQFHAALKPASQIVTKMREVHRAGDEAILARFLPNFRHRGPIEAGKNESGPSGSD